MPEAFDRAQLGLEEESEILRLLAAVLCDPGNPVIVGEMAYLGSQRRSASVRSSGGSLALCLRPAHVDAIIAGFPGLTRVICAQFSRRLKEADDAFCELQTRFSTGAQSRVASPGEVLFRKGEASRTLFQVMSGRVRLEGEGGAELLGPDRLPEGFLEFESYLRGRPHGVTAIVEETAFLVTIDADHREAILRGFPGLVLGILEG